MIRLLEAKALNFALLEAHNFLGLGREILAAIAVPSASASDCVSKSDYEAYLLLQDDFPKYFAVLTITGTFHRNHMGVCFLERRLDAIRAVMQETSVHLNL